MKKVIQSKFKEQYQISERILNYRLAFDIEVSFTL